MRLVEGWRGSVRREGAEGSGVYGCVWGTHERYPTIFPAISIVFVTSAVAVLRIQRDESGVPWREPSRGQGQENEMRRWKTPHRGPKL